MMGKEYLSTRHFAICKQQFRRKTTVNEFFLIWSHAYRQSRISNTINSAFKPITAKKIAKMYDFIDSGNFSAAQKIIDELNRLIPDDPDIVRAEYLVRALNQ